MGSDLTVAPAFLPYDIAGIREFLTAEAASMNISPDKLATRRDEFLASAQVPWDLFLVAREGRAFRGLAIISTDSKFSVSHKGSLRIQVSENARGRGIGSALLTAALEWADARGLVRVEASPYAGPGGLLKTTFFGTHGFEVEGYLRKAARLVNGEYADVVAMARVR